jgi:hypothetical protein
MADSNNKTNPMVGTIQRRSAALAKKSNAQIPAMMAKIILAVTVALSAV